MSNDKHPDTTFASKYPYNRAMVSESGHSMEFDDTPGAERIRVAHRTGTYWEVSPDGRKVELVTADDYRYVKGGLTLTIDNNQDVLVSGNSRIVIRGDSHIEVGGDAAITVAGDSVVATVGNQTALVGGDQIAKVDGNVQMKVDGNVNQDIGGDMSAYVHGDTALKVNGDLNAEVEGDLKATISGDGDVTVSGDTTVTASTVTVKADDITLDGDVKVTKTLEVDDDATFKGSSVKHNSKEIGEHHKHSGVQTGSGVSGEVN